MILPASSTVPNPIIATRLDPPGLTCRDHPDQEAGQGGQPGLTIAVPTTMTSPSGGCGHGRTRQR